VIGILAILQSGKQVDAPSGAPSRGVVTLYFKSLGTSLGQVGSFGHRDVMSRIKAEKVRLMTMLRVLVFPIVIPLLQIPLFTYFIRLQAFEGTLHLLTKRFVSTQCRCCFTSIHKTFANHGQVRHIAIEHRPCISVRSHIAVFGRSARRGHQLSVLLNEPSQTELCSPLQHRIVFPQEILVSREQIVLPNVCRGPCSTHIPRSPHRVTIVQPYGTSHGPNVSVVSQAPASVHSIVSLCRFATRFAQVHNKVQQGVVQFAQISRFNRPIVLLHVDVGGIIAAPWRKQTFIPQSLQVGRHSGCARAGNEQIPAILEIERLQFRVRLVLIRVESQLLVGGQRRDASVRRSQVQRHTVEQALIVIDMRCSQVSISFS